MKSKAIFIVLGILVISCKKQAKPVIDFIFSEPVPIFKMDLKKIPKSYLGTYGNENNEIIVINDTYILSKTNYDSKLSKSEITTAELDSLKDNSYGDSTFLTSIINENKDSIEIRVTVIDTIYKMDPSNKVRKWQKYLFLNELTYNSKWSTQIISLKNNTLYYGELINYDNIDSLIDHNQMKMQFDSLYDDKFYAIDPSKNDLKILLESANLNHYNKIL